MYSLIVAALACMPSYRLPAHRQDPFGVSFFLKLFSLTQGVILGGRVPYSRGSSL